MRMYAGVFHAKTVHILVCTTHPAGEYSPAVHTYASSRGVLPSPACNKWWLVGGRSYIISRGVLLSRIAFVYHIWPGSTPQPCPSPMFCACLAGEYSQPCISWLLVNASGRGVLPSRALWAQWVVVQGGVLSRNAKNARMVFHFFIVNYKGLASCLCLL